ncbi:MAG: hypothetical protein MZV64_00395 [Ignavibacteriales bacterium]|nr:hypothetical protein [Ignavibacteriales bacterium]
MNVSVMPPSPRRTTDKPTPGLGVQFRGLISVMVCLRIGMLGLYPLVFGVLLVRQDPIGIAQREHLSNAFSRNGVHMVGCDVHHAATGQIHVRAGAGGGR